jgi:DNA-binding MarR family transcriptional regulator
MAPDIMPDMTMAVRRTDGDPMESTDPDRELVLLEQIENDPDITQASLAALLGVAVGTVNWHIKRFISKGYIKVKRAQRRKLRYIITPEGLAMRARLTVNYLETSMRMYRHTRQRVRELISQARQAGFNQIRIEGESDTVNGDIVDICRLTCLEQGITIVHSPTAEAGEPGNSGDIPVLEVQGTKVVLRMEAKS